MAEDQALDIIGGSAGCIGGLLSLHFASGSETALEIAKLCGDHLIAAARPQEEGLAWQTEIDSSRPLCGFSHGAAGFAWALGELGLATGERRFVEAAAGAMSYERSVFDAYARNWPDFRIEDGVEPPKEEGESLWMATWCHGAPGVGLGRTRAYRYFPDREILEEIETAVATTLERGFGLNHSLCHGDLGNVELLLEGSRILPGNRFSKFLESTTSSILASIDEHGFLCGVPSGVETPGLMTGLSGIGYGLLRLAEPEAVPSVLTLEPPPEPSESDDR